MHRRKRHLTNLILIKTTTGGSDMPSPTNGLSVLLRRFFSARRCLSSSTSSNNSIPDNLFDTRIENKSTAEWTQSVYPAGRVETSIGIQKSRVWTDPRTTSVILFPGQGSQYVGMGCELMDFPNVPEMFEVANRILGYDILDICMNGPKLTLDRTDHSQAAVFLVSLAAVEKLRFEKPTAVENCVATAGFSVGEITSLVLAGALDFESALRLVKIRGEIMKSAAEESQSGLMNIIYGADGRIGLACSSAIDWCIRKGVHPDLAVCEVAYYLFPHCKVIGGHEEALRFIQENRQDFGIKRCTRLPDKAAFHTSLMQRPNLKFHSALEKTNIMTPKIPVISNVTAAPMKTTASIRQSLMGNLINPVKLEQLLHATYSRPQDKALPFTFQCGPGKSLLDILDKVNLRARKQAHRVYA
jgi:[acyl-carrier-protein] S-malonyltransferase